MDDIELDNNLKAGSDGDSAAAKRAIDEIVARIADGKPLSEGGSHAVASILLKIARSKHPEKFLSNRAAHRPKKAPTLADSMALYGMAVGYLSEEKRKDLGIRKLSQKTLQNVRRLLNRPGTPGAPKKNPAKK